MKTIEATNKELWQQHNLLNFSDFQDKITVCKLFHYRNTNRTSGQWFYFDDANKTIYSGYWRQLDYLDNPEHIQAQINDTSSFHEEVKDYWLNQSRKCDLSFKEINQIQNKRRYKVLPLGFPFSCKRRYWKDCVQDKNKITPIFNRNGFYLDRLTKITWLEINGEAWLYLNHNHFQFELEHSLGNNRIHPDAYNAIQTLINHNLADDKLKKIHQIETEIRELRQLRIGSTTFAKQVFNKLKEKVRESQTSLPANQPDPSQ